MYELNETTLDYMPLPKQQLKNHVSVNYEEAADYSNYSLVMEYHYLKNNYQLHLIHEAECLTSPEMLKL
jgi:hypothetical protein